MKPKPLPSMSRLAELLDYDAETGVFYWKKDRNWNSKAGFAAGHLAPDGYIHLKIDGARFLAHRVAWFMSYKTEPLVIDHADCDKQNNRLANLRNGTQSDNCANSKMRSTSNSPFKCVQWRKKDRLWQARICVRGKRRSLGHFTTAEAAAAAYRAAAIVEFGEYARFSPDPNEHSEAA